MSPEHTFPILLEWHPDPELLLCRLRLRPGVSCQASLCAPKGRPSETVGWRASPFSCKSPTRQRHLPRGRNLLRRGGQSSPRQEASLHVEIGILAKKNGSAESGVGWLGHDLGLQCATVEFSRTLTGAFNWMGSWR